MSKRQSRKYWVDIVDLQTNLTEGVECIVSESVKATLKNPKESAFILKFASASRAASKKREKQRIEANIYRLFLSQV